MFTHFGQEREGSISKGPIMLGQFVKRCNEIVKKFAHIPDKANHRSALKST